jgi:hypothetical protein
MSKEFNTFIKENFPAFGSITRYLSGSITDVIIHAGAEYIIYRVKTDYKLSIGGRDMTRLIELGFDRMQCNNPGSIDLYFKLHAAYYGDYPLIFTPKGP